VAAGVVAVVVNFAQGNTGFAVVLLVLFAGIAWWSWPGRQGSHVAHAAAQAEADDDDVVVYWRPG
jgi:ABC-type microcin C transport system permease subunit YejB